MGEHNPWSVQTLKTFCKESGGKITKDKEEEPGKVVTECELEDGTRLRSEVRGGNENRVVVEDGNISEGVPQKNSSIFSDIPIAVVRDDPNTGGTGLAIRENGKVIGYR